MKHSISIPAFGAIQCTHESAVNRSKSKSYSPIKTARVQNVSSNSTSQTQTQTLMISKNQVNLNRHYIQILNSIMGMIENQRFEDAQGMGSDKV
jgi:hypothetical protein